MEVRERTSTTRDEPVLVVGESDTADTHRYTKWLDSLGTVITVMNETELLAVLRENAVDCIVCNAGILDELYPEQIDDLRELPEELTVLLVATVTNTNSLEVHHVSVQFAVQVDQQRLYKSVTRLLRYQRYRTLLEQYFQQAVRDAEYANGCIQSIPVDEPARHSQTQELTELNSALFDIITEFDDADFETVFRQFDVQGRSS